MENLVVLDDWMIIRISGKDATKFLDGLTTRDLSQFEMEKAYLSAFLNPKGKISSLFWLVKTKGELAIKGQSILMFVPPEFKQETVQDLLKYNINVEIKLEDLTQETPPAVYISSNPVKDGFENQDPYFFFFEGSFNFKKLGEDFHPYSAFSQRNPDLVPFSVFKGLNPLECGLKGIVDLSKGCFLGQEPISRMTYRGRPRFQLIRTFLPTTELEVDSGLVKFDLVEIGKVIYENQTTNVLIWQLRARDLDEMTYKRIINETRSSLLGNY